MINTLSLRILTIGLIAAISITGYGQEFELKKKAPEPRKIEKPLFDLLKSDSMPQSQSNSQWQTNPFFNQSLPTEKEPTTIPAPTNAAGSVTEYKITAIWNINNRYKALISGQILKAGDVFNDVKVIKVDSNGVTFKRKYTPKFIPIGTAFYDFQI
jgi:hypothetical protein